MCLTKDEVREERLCCFCMTLTRALYLIAALIAVILVFNIVDLRVIAICWNTVSLLPFGYVFLDTNVLLRRQALCSFYILKSIAEVACLIIAVLYEGFIFIDYGKCCVLDEYGDWEFEYDSTIIKINYPGRWETQDECIEEASEYF